MSRTAGNNVGAVKLTDDDIIEIFDIDHYDHSEGATVVEEHGQKWVSCADCGAQWGVAETTGKEVLLFEQVSVGDDSCYERAALENDGSS